MATSGKLQRELRSSEHPPFRADSFTSWFEGSRRRHVARLLELISIRTESPREEACFPWLEERVREVGGVSRVEPPPADLDRHPLFTRTPFAEEAPLRPNLRAVFRQDADAPPLTVNAHVDVVPAGEFTHGYAPAVERDHVVGRGAADTKNNIVMLLGALEFLRDAGIPLAYAVHADFVVEEEYGGNGTLASILNGSPDGEVIVLEPTSLQIFRGHRGCLSFEVHVRTPGSHMGSGTGTSAIDGAIAVIAELRRLERRLTREARLDDDFRTCKRPTPVNIGFMQGGEWHGTVPSRCEVRGNLGFLPRYDVAAVRSMVEATIAGAAADWPEASFEVTYSGIHNGAFVIPDRTPLVERLRSSRRRRLGRGGRVRGWGASCDARYYHELLGLPVVIFGCGDLAEAHSTHERLQIGQLGAGMSVLSDFLATPATGAAS